MIDMSRYLPCIQDENQNGVAYGCRSSTRILRQLQILKSQSYNNLHFMQKMFLTNICFHKLSVSYNI